MVRLCTEEDCPNKHYAHGKCYEHYVKDPEIKAAKAARVKVGKGKLRCSVIENGVQCDHHRIGKKIYCDKHYRRTRRNPDKDPATTESRESINIKISEALTNVPKSKEHKKNLSESTMGRTSPRKYVTLDQSTKDKISKANMGRPSGFKNKKHKPESRKKASISALNREPETKENRDKRVAKIINTYNTDPRIAKAISEHHKNSPKVMAAIAHARTVNVSPNKPEKAIQAILLSIGITPKFGVELDYINSEGKVRKKKTDWTWKNSGGKKKLIEYNGYRHFDPRVFQPDQIVSHHNTKKPAHEVWDEEIPILNQIRKAGYEILVVWAKDFKDNLEDETKRIVDFALSKL